MAATTRSRTTITSLGAHGITASLDRRGCAIPESRGTYALLMRCKRVGTLAVGSLGAMHVEPGVYLYIGSAFGPGGLRARLSRHAARQKVRRWHIDYLRPRMSLAGAWFSTLPHHLEHDWAAGVLALVGAGEQHPSSEPRQCLEGSRSAASGTIPLRRFGASDCACASHLVHFPDSDCTRRSIADALEVSAPDALAHVEAEALRGLTRRRR